MGQCNDWCQILRFIVESEYQIFNFYAWLGLCVNPCQCKKEPLGPTVLLDTATPLTHRTSICGESIRVFPQYNIQSVTRCFWSYINQSLDQIKEFNSFPFSLIRLKNSDPSLKLQKGDTGKKRMQQPAIFTNITAQIVGGGLFLLFFVILCPWFGYFRLPSSMRWWPSKPRGPLSALLLSCKEYSNSRSSEKGYRKVCCPFFCIPGTIQISDALVFQRWTTFRIIQSQLLSSSSGATGANHMDVESTRKYIIS